MDADLDLLLAAVFCSAGDLLPGSAENARRRVTDAEVVALCVAQAIMGIASERRCLAVAAQRLGHLFARLPQQPGYFKRRRRLADTLGWLMAMYGCARTLAGPRERIRARRCCPAAAITFNHQLRRPSRALVNNSA
jgi:hypothetical protein